MTDCSLLAGSVRDGRHIHIDDVAVKIDIDLKSGHTEVFGKPRRGSLPEHRVDLLIDVFQLVFEHRHGKKVCFSGHIRGGICQIFFIAVDLVRKETDDFFIQFPGVDVSLESVVVNDIE